MNPTELLLRWFKDACLREALKPAGGTPMKGSAHPKLPPCGRSAGIAKDMRATPRKVNYEQPPVYAKPKPYKRATPKIGRNEPCPCNSGKKWKRCCMQMKAVAA